MNLYSSALSQPSPDKPAQSPLPDILPGFNLDKGLVTLNGNPDLYARLLKEFYDRYKTAEQYLDNNLTSGDIQEAKLFVHTIKGLAANLAASDLYTAAVELEKTLLQTINHGQLYPAAVTGFQTAFHQSMQSLAAWCDTQKNTGSVKTPIAHVVRNKKTDFKEIASLMSSLSLHIQTANPQSLEVFFELRKVIRNCNRSGVFVVQQLVTSLDNLESELNSFQFDAAANILKHIQQLIK